MIRKTRLFTPGSPPLLPAAQFARAPTDIHHRTPEFRALYQRVLGQLKVFVGTNGKALLAAQEVYAERTSKAASETLEAVGAR
jgi:aspartate aminotransferase-like enzyme